MTHRLPAIVALPLLALACKPAAFQPVLQSSDIFVMGVGDTNSDCRAGICPHNENTDMIRWGSAIYLVHRTANSQILGPNSSLHIYRSTDEGATFMQTAVILAPAATELPDGGLSTDLGDGGFDAPSGRDIRDPCFYIVGNDLYLKALTRLPVTSSRDSGVNTIAVEMHSSDGVNWTAPNPMGPIEWSFWRIKQEAGIYYNAAYHDGDSAVSLFSSPDGVTWTQGADIFSISAATPLETELSFLPSGRVLALVRTDGDDAQLLGDEQLMEQVCWAVPPYSTFTCDPPLMGVRLDGPLSFFKDGRLFVVARKHLGANDEKRTAVYEITGNLEGGPIGIKEWVDLPSAGDTSYAGGVLLNSGSMMLSWYSSDLAPSPYIIPMVEADEPWGLGMLAPANIWLGTLAFEGP